MGEKTSKEIIERGEHIRLGDISLWRVGDFIIEVVVDEGTNARGEHICELFELVREMSPAPFALMINRENDYSVGFSVLWEARKNNPFKFVAMVNNGRRQQYFSPSLWPRFSRLALFEDRKDALHWLYKRIAE